MDLKEIEKLAVKHESFGFGLADPGEGLTTHGFEPEGLQAFVAELLMKERGEIAAAIQADDVYPGNDWGAGYAQASRDIAAGVLSRGNAHA